MADFKEDEWAYTVYVPEPEPEPCKPKQAESKERHLLLSAKDLEKLNHGEFVKLVTLDGSVVTKIIPPQPPAQTDNEKRADDLGHTPETFDDDLAKVIDRAKQRIEAVKTSEFGVAPQVGKMLLDGLKRIVAEIQGSPDIQTHRDKLQRVWPDLVALLAVLAETLKDPAKMAGIDEIAGNTSDMPPEAYGQQLLGCLDHLRQHRSTKPSGFSLAFGNGAKLVCKRKDFDSPITARIVLP